MKVSQEFPDMTFLPFMYGDVSEVKEIIESNRLLVDQWLFSGVMNYSFAIENKLIDHKEGSYPLLHGSSFFGTLLEAQLDRGKIYRKISIDNFKETELEKVLSFYNLQPIQYYSMPFQSHHQLDNLVNFHRKLLEENKVEIAITAVRYAYDKLKKEGYPVYRLTPSYLAIKLTIELLGERAQAHLFENRQMAIIGCKVLNTANTGDQYQFFKWKHHELNLKKSLLELTENISGSFVEEGDGLYFIFTTKGELDKEVERALYQLIDEYQVRDQISIGITIGFGENVLHAEHNVRYGLNQAKINEQSPITVVEGRYEITERLTSAREDVFNMDELKQRLADKFDKEVASPRDVMRIYVYAHKYNLQKFTAEDISRWLQSTERNGRRILAELEQANVVRKCGKVQSNQRGRPKNVYCFVEHALVNASQE
ncbi:hypothetical protein [Oceanobacillus iheyensis]|nr:hypothetical protein [Oceanobacillus iheyensis]